MRLDRVLIAGVPAVLVFYEQELPSDLRQSLEDPAQRQARKALIVTLDFDRDVLRADRPVLVDF